MIQTPFTCQITGLKESPIRCHLVPKSLGIKSRGKMLFDVDGEAPAKRRPGGWYDSKLVCRKGEDYLSALDEYAVNYFRSRGFLFSERRDQGKTIGGLQTPIADGLIKATFDVELRDPLQIKLFALSLLWRAAATNRPEFAKVNLRRADTERIRQYIVGAKTPKWWEYPVIIGLFDDQYQFTDQSPVVERVFRTKFVRWCLNGVIIRVAMSRVLFDRQSLGGLAVGFHPDRLKGLVCRYNESAQRRYTDRIFLTHLARFGAPGPDSDEPIGYPEFEFDSSGRRIPVKY